MKRPASDLGQGDHGEHNKRPQNDPVLIVRVICPVDRSGPVIGKGGDVIRSIREGTGARVKVEDVVPGLQERAVVITSPDRPGEPMAPAQDALLRVVARIVEAELPGGVEIPEKVEMRIMLDKVYISWVIGKGGESINKIKAASGATVVVLPHGGRNPLAGSDEETIKFAGPYESVKTAMKLVMDKVREASNKGMRPSFSTQELGHVLPPGMLPQPSMALPMGGPPVPRPPPDAMNQLAGGHIINTDYRLLVPDHRIGTVIGKGGEKLRSIREETGAEVRVERAVEGCKERLVVCHSAEPVEAEYCAAAEALMMCTTRVVREKGTAPSTTTTIRILAPANQMGAVLGLKGVTIRQITQDTGCKLLVLPRQQVPPGLGMPNDEILQIDGPVDGALAATRIVTMLLRGIMIRQQTGESNMGMGAAIPPQQQQGPPPFSHGPPAHHGPPPPAPPPPHGPPPQAQYGGYASSMPPQPPQVSAYQGVQQHGQGPHGQMQAPQGPGPQAAQQPYQYPQAPSSAPSSYPAQASSAAAAAPSQYNPTAAIAAQYLQAAQYAQQQAAGQAQAQAQYQQQAGAAAPQAAYSQQPAAGQYGQVSQQYGQQAQPAQQQPQQQQAAAATSAATAVQQYLQAASAMYGQQPAAASAYGQQPSATAYGQQQQAPSTAAYGQQPTAASAYGQQPAAASAYGQQPTSAATAYGQQPPAASAATQQYQQQQQAQQQQQQQAAAAYYAAYGSTGTGASDTAASTASASNPYTSSYGASAYGTQATAANPWGAAQHQQAAAAQPATGGATGQTQAASQGVNGYTSTMPQMSGYAQTATSGYAQPGAAQATYSAAPQTYQAQAQGQATAVPGAAAGQQAGAYNASAAAAAARAAAAAMVAAATGNTAATGGSTGSGTLENPNYSMAGMPPGTVRMTMTLPPQQIGTLLGTKGANISAIRTNSGARIKVHDNPNQMGEREVEATGTLAQCQSAAAMIQHLLNQGVLPNGAISRA